MSQPIRAIAPTLAVVDGIPTTTSNEVAQHFGKQHMHVMERIRALTAETPSSFNESNFRLVEFTDAKGERRPAYRLTRDGFTLLAMGFTGKKALAFKLAYIDAFNKMERELVSRADKAPYSVAPNQTLPAADADMLRDLITRHAETLPKEDRAAFVIKAWAKLKAHFGVSYRQIPAHQFTEAMSIIGRHIAEPAALGTSSSHEKKPEALIEMWLQPNGYSFDKEFLVRLAQCCIARIWHSHEFYRAVASGKAGKLTVGTPMMNSSFGPPKTLTRLRKTRPTKTH